MPTAVSSGHMIVGTISPLLAKRRSSQGKLPSARRRLWAVAGLHLTEQNRKGPVPSHPAPTPLDPGPGPRSDMDTWLAAGATRF